MAIRSRDEIMEMVRGRIGDDTSDESIAFLEDVQDTLGHYESRLADTTDWRRRYAENDEEWRRRYRDRFFGLADEAGPGNTTTTPENVVQDNETDLESESHDKSFDELFTEKGDNSGY